MKADGFDHKAVVNKLVEPDSPLSPPGINTLLYYIICSVGLIYGLYDPYVKYMCNMIYSTTYLLYHPSYRKHSEGHTPWWRRFSSIVKPLCAKDLLEVPIQCLRQGWNPYSPRWRWTAQTNRPPQCNTSILHRYDDAVYYRGAVHNLFRPRAVAYYFQCTRGPKTKLWSVLLKVQCQKQKVKFI